MQKDYDKIMESVQDCVTILPEGREVLDYEYCYIGRYQGKPPHQADINHSVKKKGGHIHERR